MKAAQGAPRSALKSHLPVAGAHAPSPDAVLQFELRFVCKALPLSTRDLSPSLQRDWGYERQVRVGRLEQGTKRRCRFHLFRPSVNKHRQA